jgi:hypothetical protein
MNKSKSQFESFWFMKNYATAALFLLSFSCFSLHASDKQKFESFLCIADHATGFTSTSGTWKTAKFDVSTEKYVLSNRDGKWNWSEIGQNQSITKFECGEKDNNGFISCKGGFGETVSFNSSSLRFQSNSPLGYVVKDVQFDKNAVTPVFTIGRCSRV